MPAGGFSVAAPAGTEFEAKITPIVIISCIMASTGGLMFGYDVGISGGVTSMDDFLKKFFPTVYRQKHEDKESNYCKYNNQDLQLFTSSLYLAGLTATFFASYTTRNLGRRLTMLIAGIFFLVGVVFNAAAQDLAMLIVGRILLGCGVGFANQVGDRRFLCFSRRLPHQNSRRPEHLVPAQCHDRHPLRKPRQLRHFQDQWMGLAAVAGAGGHTGGAADGGVSSGDGHSEQPDRARAARGREGGAAPDPGTPNIEPEFEEILAASRAAQRVKHPFRNLLQRRNRPQLVIAVVLQIFQQFTGINAIMFYAPVLFNTLGFKSDAALYSAVITGAVNVLSTLVSIYSVDRIGRRMLLLEAGVQMFLSQVVIAVLLGIKVTDHSDDLSRGYAVLVVVMVCTFVSSFAWSWGPLGWLIPSETFPLETRSAGQSVTVCANLLFTFVIAQAFLSMLCSLKYGIFAFFSAWVVVMSLFVLFLLPETKNVPIEEMTERVWKQHWFWKRFMDDDADYGVEDGDGDYIKKPSSYNNNASNGSNGVRP
uniref:Major facilitator superfamily (MFS) profile domain-containing protein n=1 Tax=Ananas comosus var. bracteatus TaxID=296719 RepID=A0A6V7Q411_ANACO|nr:unnamed protein product [Ananas comosus var. bracteatus]